MATMDDEATAALRDRYRGALVGMAAGDALGATVEFESRETIRERHGVHREIIGGGWLQLPAGEVTDDTQMALCIARSIVALGAADPADIADRFVAWYRSDPPDIGNTTRDALRRLDAGVAWQEASQLTHEDMQPRDASNGSLMRTAPVALYARRNHALNARLSADISRITHANPLCVDACVAYDDTLAALLDDPDIDPIALAHAAAREERTREALATLPALATPLEAGGFVLDTLVAALWALSRHSSAEEVIIAAVNLGEDADTTGAVAGALAGARWGYRAIPERWRAALLAHDELVTLADGLLALSLAMPPRGATD